VTTCHQEAFTRVLLAYAALQEGEARRLRQQRAVARDYWLNHARDAFTEKWEDCTNEQ